VPGADVQPGNSTVPSSCAKTVTPACLQALYGIPTDPATQSDNTLAVTGYIKQYANQADLADFLKAFRTDMDSSTTFSEHSLDGGSNPQSSKNAGEEADLDTQYTVGVAT
jgi:tripeptidyl-peptidase-1